MRFILGFLEIAILVWGIVECWGTPWSIAALVWLLFDICLAFYLTGKQQGAKKNLTEELNNLISSFKDKDNG